MQVIYIMLLLVVTIICIGVSAGVKYDKEQITKSSNGIPAHQDDPDYNNIQSDIDTLKNQIATLTANVNQDIETLVYNEASDIVYTYNNDLITSSGTPTIDDINTLFKYKAFYNNQSATTLIPGSDKKSVSSYPRESTRSDANLTLETTASKFLRIYFTESKLYISMDGTNPNPILTDKGYQATSFSVDEEGLLKSSNNKYILFGTNYLKLFYTAGAGTVGIRLMLTSKTTTTTSNVNQLQYFGLTSAKLYPPPINKNQSILDSSNSDGEITTLKPLRQVLGSSDTTSVFGAALNIGLFAKCIAAANANALNNATTVNNATSYTGLDAGDLKDTTNYRIHYITTHFVSNGTLELPSLWLDHTPALQPKYSIYVVLADENTPNITNFTIKDVNQSQGTQTVVLLGSPYTGDINYYQSLLPRTDGQMSTTPISTYPFSQFFSPCGDYNLNNLIFFKFNSDDSIPHSIPAVLDFRRQIRGRVPSEGGWKITTNIAKGQGSFSFIPVSYNGTQNYDLSLADFQNYYTFDNGTHTYTHKKLGGQQDDIINIP